MQKYSENNFIASKSKERAMEVIVLAPLCCEWDRQMIK
jgi:hypothetical protein